MAIGPQEPGAQSVVALYTMVTLGVDGCIATSLKRSRADTTTARGAMRFAWLGGRRRSQMSHGTSGLPGFGMRYGQIMGNPPNGDTAWP